jgi:hypothetical protein
VEREEVHDNKTPLSCDCQKQAPVDEIPNERRPSSKSRVEYSSGCIHQSDSKPDPLQLI